MIVAFALSITLFPLAFQETAPPVQTPPPVVKPAQDPTPKPTATPKPVPTPAAAPILDRDDPKLDTTITLADGAGNSVVKTRKELGFARVVQDGPVAFTANVEQVAAALKPLAPKFATEAIDAKPTVVGGKFVLFPGAAARALDVNGTAKKLVDVVAANPATRSLTVALTKTPAKRSADVFAGITGVLAKVTTTTTSNANRNTNVGIATEAINGTFLSPNEEFSLNKIVGQRTIARGYKEAIVFENAKKVPGIGGGVSQVTGTLFNAAALAGLKIVEVHPHSRPVSYLPLGRDATVAYGQKDLRFVNDTPAKVYITYTFRGRTLTATVFGAAKPDVQMSLRPKISRVGPGNIRAELYRVVKSAGKIVATEKILTHRYRWTPGE